MKKKQNIQIQKKNNGHLKYNFQKEKYSSSNNNNNMNMKNNNNKQYQNKQINKRKKESKVIKIQNKVYTKKYIYEERIINKQSVRPVKR